MNIAERIKKEGKELWSKPQNRIVIKDFLSFFVATIVFHFLYWNTNMNEWIFGPFTDRIFDFFTTLVYKAAIPLVSLITDRNYVLQDNSFLFYHFQDSRIVYDYAIQVVHDCSGVKQLLQWGLVLILCRGCWKIKAVCFVMGGGVLVLANIIRVALLTKIYSYSESMFNFTHDWVFRPLMYVIIFVMWYMWLLYVDKKTKEKKILKTSKL